MADSLFDAAFQLTWSYEKGFSSNPRDPGGDTNDGVTQSTYDDWRSLNGLPKQSVRRISGDEERGIYHDYWNDVKGDELPAGLGFAVFDYAFNSGVTHAIKDLQRTLKVVVDGHLGPVTLNAAHEQIQLRSADTVIADYCYRRMAFLKTLSTWKTFGKGWTLRVEGRTPLAQPNDFGVIDYACHMAEQAMPASQVVRPLRQPALPMPAPAPGKGSPADQRLTATPTGRSAATGLVGSALLGLGQLAIPAGHAAAAAGAVALAAAFLLKHLFSEGAA